MKLDVAYKKWDKRYAEKVSQLSAPICSTSLWDLVRSLLTTTKHADPGLKKTPLSMEDLRILVLQNFVESLLRLCR